MKEILKEWRKFLKESQSEYFPWISLLKGDDYESVLSSIRKDKDFTVLGKGGYREVFDHKSDKEHVLKLAREEGSSFFNYSEKVVSDNFPIVFPEVYANHPSYLWIVCEKCDVILAYEDEKRESGSSEKYAKTLCFY